MFAMFEILIVLIVVGLPILCVTAIILAAMFKGGGGAKRRSYVEAEETRLIQEMHQTLHRLESRIDALETIVIDSEREKERTL